MTPRILFVLKFRENLWGAYGSDLSSGLRNSVTFLSDMLNDIGITAKTVQVPDNNAIDREMHAFRPTHVILEAMWVVPSKLDVLMPLYPGVNFAVRLHSELPFLALEGMAMEWLHGYLSRGVAILCNSPRATSDITSLAYAYDPAYGDLVSYAPNYYPPGPQPDASNLTRLQDVIRIGCFGAIRPLKNHLAQATASIQFAQFLNLPLEFHINASRVESSGSPVLANLRALFQHTQQATLVEHPWVEHAEFVATMRRMDFALQCSFSETFNIVCADAVTANVPITCSAEVPWIGRYAHADPTDTRAITDNLIQCHQQLFRPFDNRLTWQWQDLAHYSDRSMKHWLDLYE